MMKRINRQINVPNKKIANILFYGLIFLQVIAVVAIFIIFDIKEHRLLRNVLIIFLAFTGTPVIGTVLVTALEKVPSPGKDDDKEEEEEIGKN